MSSVFRELQAESRRLQLFEEKCKNLMSVEEKLERELASKNPQNYSNLQEMLTTHQVLLGEKKLESVL